MSKYFYPLLLIGCLLSGIKSYGSISIDSAVAYRSTCSNNGYINIYARSTSNPILYGIKSGPITRPLQNSSQIGALPPGTYQVMAVNFTGDTALAFTTITGNYKFPDFVLTFKNPFCPRSGIIVGKPVSGTGVKPYKWELTNTGNGNITTQTTDTFKGLDAGTYSLRVYDSCLSYTTKAVTLQNTYTPLYVSSISKRLLRCNTVALSIIFQWTGGAMPPPLVSGKVQVKNKIFLDGPVSLYKGGNFYEYKDTLPGITYGDTILYTFTDVCGTVLSGNDVVGPFAWSASSATQTSDSCSIKFTVNLRTGEFNSSTVPDSGYQYTVVDSITGAVVYSGTTFSSSFRSPRLNPGTTYKFTFTDKCGNSSTVSVTTPKASLPRVAKFIETNHCLDSVSGCDISFSGFTSIPNLIFLSGPRTTIHSSKRLFEYSDSIDFYNKTYRPSATGIYFFVNMAAGTYTFIIADSCGNSITDSVTIKPADVHDDRFVDDVIKGCPGENKMIISFSSSPNAYGSAGSMTVKNLANGSTIFTEGGYSYGRRDTIYNLDYGKYAVTLNRSVNSSYYPATSKIKCKIVTDTVTILPYTPPVISYVTVLKCNGQLIVILNPDSAHGVAPYRYEVINGPETFPRQSSNVFLFSQKGGYTARIIDTCDNAQTYFFVVDTISKPVITLSGAPCFGNSIKLIGQRSPYFNYVWQRPNGTVYRGDTLDVGPIATNDTGTYNIIRINRINNCVDSTLTSYLLTGNIQTELKATICGAQTITVAGHVYSTTGVYRDTILTPNCDSIIILDLKLVDHLEDSIERTICFGESVTIGAHTYTQTGIYRDTFATIYCDSIFILKLGVLPWGRDTVIQSICNGQSVTVGTHIYTQTGFYTDTLPSGNCYTIHNLNLLVNSFKYDSVSQQICSGQRITVGSHTYNQTGIYRDTLATSSCDSIHILNLTVLPLPFNPLVQTICTGQSVTVGNHTYTAPGTYRDTLATATCDSIVELTLSVEGGIDSIAYNICVGESFIVGNHTYSETGIYRDTISGVVCDSIHIVNLTVNPLPVVSATSDKSSIFEGDTVLLSAWPSDLVYQWAPTGVLNDPSLQNPTAILDSSMWFIVIATDSFTSCSNIDSVFVEVQDKNCDGKIAIPSAFSPNQDRHNDFFEVIWLCPVKDFEVTIYNPWGQKIFESNDPYFKWDGLFTGQLQPAGTYMYYIKAVTLGGKELKFNNSVTLLH